MNICIIPAKGNSQGLPGKNTRLLGGYPLLVWQITSALNSKLYERVVVSSEDSEVLRIAGDHGAHTVVRPQRLSEPTATSNEVVHDVLDRLPQYKPDFVTIALPTAPFTGVEGHKLVNHLMEAVHRPAVHLATQIDVDPPTRTYTLLDDGTIEPLIDYKTLNIDQRQFHPETYRSTYGATCFTREALNEGVWFPEHSVAVTITKSHQKIDIDDWDDWMRAYNWVKLHPETWNEVTSE